jgi:hypothetical protein
VIHIKFNKCFIGKLHKRAYQFAVWDGWQQTKLHFALLCGWHVDAPGSSIISILQERISMTVQQEYDNKKITGETGGNA